MVSLLEMQEFFDIGLCSACHKLGNSLGGDEAANIFSLPKHNQTKMSEQQNQPSHKKETQTWQSISHGIVVKLCEINQDCENEWMKLKKLH